MEIETTKSSGGGSTSSADNASTNNITISYLHRMIYYTQSLLTSPTSTSNKIPTTTADINTYLKEKENSNDNAEELMNILGQTLLTVCNPYNLLSSLDIPKVFLEHDDDLMTDNNNAMNDDDNNSDMDEDDEDDQEENIPYHINSLKIKSGKPRSYTRIDVLRSILRCLSPIVMDLGSRIASHVLLLSSTSGNDVDGKKKEEGDTSSSSDYGSNERLQSYILFSYWVKDAPQLVPIVTDLFAEFHKFSNDDSSGCPLVSLPFVAKQMKLVAAVDDSVAESMQHRTDHDNSTTTREDEEAAVIVCEATYELLKVYCNKRNEEMYVRKWWDWDTVLFVLLHSHDYHGGVGSMKKLCMKGINKEEDGDVVMTSSSTNNNNKKNNNNDNDMDEDTQEDTNLISYYIGGYSPQTNVPNSTLYKIPTYQMKWYISRCISSLFALRPMSQSNFLKKFNVVEEEVPFVRHPWNVNINDATWEVHLMNGIGRVVLRKLDNAVLSFGDGSSGGKKPTSKEEVKDNDEYIFQLPSITDVRKVIPLHRTLVHTGDGILLTRRGSVASYLSYCQSSLFDGNKLNENDSTTLDKPSSSSNSNCFIPTKTTISNMSTLGIAMSSDPHPPPILVCGPSGSGKSSIVREMARQCSSFTLNNNNNNNNNNNPENELLELHIDEETDSKTLLGSYVATDIPGEFVWMAGPLTLAARQGRWVLIEDVDRCPEEIQAALIRLFEERILPLGVNREEKCHPRFRLFGTCVTNVNNTTKKSSRRKASLSVGAGGKRILHPNLWRMVHVDPLPFTELRDVGRLLHPDLPYSVADAVLDVLRKLDKSGRGDDQIDDDDDVDNNDSIKVDKDILGHGARHASVREYIKLLSRISSAIQFEPGSEYATESQRLICLAETVDVFAMSCPSLEKRRDFICQLGAPAWNLTADAGMRYIESRIPSLSRGGHNNRCVEVGRARLLALKREEDDMDISAPGKKRNFAETNHALRLMESVAVCASQNEPALLVGETGCGKTTLVQRLANLTGRSLLVQNLSLQTDSTDLLGGYKPLEMRHVARGVYDKFVDLFVSSFSRSQNAQFLKYVLTAFEKGDWKKLAQCFTKAASMGENKMKELMRKGKEATNLEAWADFRSIAERFERQRIASESGLAFLFTEGALVDAIRTGRWVLLDEINLASSETLQRLCGLLDDSHGSITLTEKGDAEAVVRHPDFRLFAAMNPATDAGKKDLPPSIRSRFTELYVDELVDAVQLRSVAARYLDGAVVTTGVPLEHSESVMTSVDIYLQCRLLSDQSLVDGGGQKPRYTMRTLCRTLSAARNLIIQQRFAPQRAILEGFQLAFEGSLDLPSRSIIKKQFTTLMPKGTSQKERDHPGRRPDGRNGGESYVLIKPFWIKSGKEEQVDWAEPTTSSNGKPKFVLTPSDIPEDEMIIILERRCGCPPSHAKLLVKVMKSLRQRRSRTGIFRGKDGLITPRDLLRWAGRGASSKQELAMEGYMLLAERLRIDEEKDVVRAVIEKELKVNINVNETYYGEESDGCVMLKQVLENTSLSSESGLNVNSIAPTQSIMRLLTLVMRCIKQKEPVLLVGDTGCGKTTVVQLLSIILQRQLTVVNCHASTETSDILGGFRPVRGRQNIAEEMIQRASDLVESWTDSSFNINEMASPFLLKAGESQSTPKQVIDYISELHKVCQDEPSNTHQQNEDSKTKKKRKLSNGNGKAVDSSKTSVKPDAAHCQMVETAYREIELLYQKYCALFEWADGPLVCSMKDRSLLLLDEMSLAEDAVLERLNSVLEPSRTLTLAEKGGEGPTCVHESDNNTELLFSSEVKAHEDFRIFATMNPGGDFGKRELSPALRSRFTEIWVPPIKRRDDIDLVLERSFSSSIEHDIISDIDSTLAGVPNIRRMMLDYFQWFNVDICDDPNSFCNDFKLSLRDILSWSRFIADVSLKNKIIDQNSAYVHGASLMHLDGLGLGTGVSNQDATVTRNKAKEFLLSQLSSVSQGTAANVVGFRDELKGIEELMVSTKDCFGINPFTITTGTEQIPSNLGFNLTAPTTGLNLRRVLRGMQISKPILLEGSPGVGKTSLIQALAKASGHHLVRINLSEQTDISDLMGSDLPYSGENDNSDGASNGASFRWCDGVLLKAIKRGDWVLLDELNLASQSVLEGLNSCLDHRASVYIPELGKSFDCPSTFRIFAAQNPLAQGGGRKGLPKSFLNRFTKVYIEALTNDDMFSIVAAQFPSIPTDIVERMIYFNEGVQQDIDSRLYGQSGSPWEFNLRDIFRWCQLLQSDDNNNGEISSDCASKYADMLYTQRLRTDHDRALITKRFQAHFGSVSKEPFTKLEVGEKHVLVGTTRLERFLDTSHWFDIPTQNSSSDIAQSLLRPMEAVACCVRMNWPCLLIGTASSGKSTLLKTLGDACNAHIETLAMTSSTDVTELIGCFEQADAMGGMKDVLKSMKEIYDGSCLAGRVGVETTRSINKHYWHLNRELLKLDQSKSLVTVDKSLLSAIDKLVVCYEKTIRLYPEFSASYSDQITLARQWLSSMKRKSAASKVQSPFQWVDGILVKAMEQGYWLHLENVNYCPSSVLDRLNPLMEFGGELVMTECGIADEDSTAKPRVIQPHPNFRLFLSMNPNSHGEVSRAMRNRCIEVSVLPSTLSEPQEVETGSLVETIDAYTAVWNSEVRSHHVGHCMVTAHKDDCHRNMELQEDSHSIKVLKDWGGLFIGLLKRGVAASSLSASHKILYEVYETDIQQLTSSLSGLLITGISTREDLVSNPSYGNIAQASRLLQVMINLANNHEISSALDQFVSMKPQSSTSYKLDKVQQQTKLLIQAICRLMEDMLPSPNIDYMISFFDGFCSKTASQMKMVMIILNDIISKYGSDQDSSVLLLSNISAGYASRVPHLLEESVTYHQLHNINDVPEPSEISVIEVSYYMDKKRIDASIVSCPVTPLLFPLFQTLDEYLSSCYIDKSNKEVVAVHEHLLLCRDRLWQCLRWTQYIGLSNSQIGFEFTGFLIQYCWIKKAFVKFSKCIGEKVDSSTTTPEKSLLLSFETIDDSIQESTGGSITSSDILWKKGGHPKLPSKFDNYEELEHLKNISANCSLAKDDSFGFTRMVSSQFTDQLDLKELIAIKHPTLFVQKQYSNELLGALAMAYWASTDETRDVSSAKDYSITNAPRVLRKRFMDLEADFVANINLATIDTSIRTVDNVLDMDKIKTIVGEAASQSQNSDEFIKNLLTKFADVQATQIGEIWCISEEATLLCNLTQILRKHQLSTQNNNGIAKELQSLCHEIKAFINKSLVHTQWPVNDLRPYQTFLWALESESIDVDNDGAIRHLIRSILPRMLYSYYNHQWCNTYNDLDSISCDLIGPALWNQEENETSRQTATPLLGNSTKNVLVSSCAGPCRVEMNTNRSAIFRLLRLPTSDESSAYMTMENGDARITQAKKLLPLFASQTTLHSHCHQTEMIKFLLGSVFDAFEDVFGQDQLVYIKNLLESNTINNKTCEVTALFKHCKNKSIQSYMSTLLIPLIENIQAINESKEGSLVWKRHADHAWVLIGLLRLNLIVPSSPIDPGRKPAAKVEQLDCYLQEIGSNLLSHSLHYGLSYGDFAPDSQATRHLSDLSDVTTTKRSNQEKKIIERPPNAPSFHDLFREIHHFCKTVANPSSVLALVETIGDSRKSSFRSQEINWQCSATSFCTRLSLVYSMYEDITIPCINEIRAIQRGLRGLALNQAPSPQTRSIVKTQDQLLQYPFRDNRFSLLQHAMNKGYYSQVLKELLLRFDADGSVSRKQDTGIIHQSIQLAALLRLQIDQAMNRYKHVSGDNLEEANCLFSSLAHLPDDEDDKASTNNVVLTEEERDEKEFRELFPDHGAEFNRIVASALDSDDFGEDDNDEPVVDQEATNNETDIDQLSDAEISLVVSLHEEMFSGQSSRKITDNTRIRAFLSSYEAASRLGHLTEWMEKGQDDTSSLGSHLFALLLRSNSNRSLWSSSGQSSCDSTIKDFHIDPYPSESIRADLPLRNLTIRVGQLLRAFPGHAVLVALGQVVERVRQLDIQVVALGKVMSGLEVILRKAQDWEQHASQHVTLGKPLKDISSLVTSWRKLELQSWSNLLTIRESRRSIRAKRHWPRIYSLIHKAKESDKGITSNPVALTENSSVASPSWIWKGHPKLSASLGVAVDTKDIDELAKVLDAFILTSSIAEFSTRLGLVQSFANELRNECEVNVSLAVEDRVYLARMLQSLCNYYSRFAPLLMQTKTKLRDPIEKRIKDEVKLAKWDEQTYYSLAESSEKNYRKLMKFLRDYDEALDTTVLSILELNFAEGVRSSEQTQAGDHEPITIIPGDYSLFPKLSEDADKTGSNLPPSKVQSLTFPRRQKSTDNLSPNEWQAAGLTDSVDKYVLKINQYAKRMESIIPQDITSSSYDSAIVATELTDAIFVRIKSLREPNTTKQVKQRALVDLFKSLKDQGYSSMKWSVPSNIRDPRDMLQLPVPLFDDKSFSWDKNASSHLEKGESYYHRCQVEITRLRFEVSMFGSQYMSQREMTLMQGYSEYILFLISQQRCMISSMIQSVEDIDTFNYSYNNVTSSIPMRQQELSSNIASFEKYLSSLTEGLEQISLLVKESSVLVDGDKSPIHDTVAILTSCVSTLEDSYVPSFGKMPITVDQIQYVETTMATALTEVKSNIAKCVTVCSGILPATIFDSCMKDVNQALDIALSFNLKDDMTSTRSDDNLQVRVTIQKISSLVQSSLLAVQSICTSENVNDKSSIKDEEELPQLALVQNHKQTLDEYNSLRLGQINSELIELSRSLISLHDNNTSTNDNVARSLCTRAAVSSMSLVKNVSLLAKAKMSDAIVYYQRHSKFLYILLRVFRNLIAKGFCSDDVSDGGEGDGEGGAGEMKFEDDVEGTGMGEGDGKNDVTDEIENEEQLLGLKGDEEQEAAQQEKKELKEDEVDTGMEMEGDFEGEKFDLPDQPQDDNEENNSDNEEELDREMGDGDDPNEQVVDEKMWDNEEDDLEEMQQENEKFEENSKMAGEQLEDEMRTGDDDNKEEGPANEEEGAQEQADTNKKDTPQDESVDNDDQMDEKINDDLEENYEDKNSGVEVRNDEQDANEEKGGEDDEEVDMDDLNLDDAGDEDSIQGEDATGTEEMDEDMNPNEDEEDLKANDEENNDQDGDANDEEEKMEEPETIEQVGDGGVGVDEPENPDDDDMEDKETSITAPPKSQYESNDAMGVAAEDGQDTVKETNEDSPDPNDDAYEGGPAEDNKGADEQANESKGAGGSGNDGNWQRGKDEEQTSESQNEAFDDVPNPFRSPGDAEKFWHKKLDMIQDSQQELDAPGQDQQQEEENKDKDGQFEYTQDGQDNSGQVLGVAEEDQAKQLEDLRYDEFDSSKQDVNNNDMDVDGTDGKQEKTPDKSHSSSANSNKDSREVTSDSEVPEKEMENDARNEEENIEESQETNMEEEEEIQVKSNKASTDRMQMQDSPDDDVEGNYESDNEIQEIELSEGMTFEDVQQARAYWQTIQSDTNNLSRRLCEKLRLVMEPLVATKLRGDYRTGKRVNMKRIIGYIASGYRKDKIWLRRTKPAKRDYRVLIAVDDSESMQKSQAGDMALRALATLANGMSQLEIGQLGIASFGEDMNLLHPFNTPFTSESGVNVVSNFRFDAKRTRTALCVESSIASLEGASSVSSSMQLVFMISDGRIERDSRSKLRRLIRQMAEKNMLMVMIIVEGEKKGSASKGNDSILNMKEVSFVNGKPKIKHFIEDYPFPYYLVVGDLAALPEILGDCLRQWFEMLAQINNQS